VVFRTFTYNAFISVINATWNSINLGDILKELKLDYMVQSIPIIGCSRLHSCVTVDLRQLPNSELALLSGGMILLGLALERFQTYSTGFMPPNYYTGGTSFQGYEALTATYISEYSSM